MANFFSRAPLENEIVKDAIINQILLFNCIIGITFGVNENSDRTNYIVGRIYEWHYALNWLVGAYNTTNWDEIRTHT
jgi:hypothetical protein